MKYLQKTIIIILSSLTFLSCKKEHKETAPVTIAIEGLYTGKYGYGSDVPDAVQRYNFKTGGIIENQNPYTSTILALGTWTLNGHVLTGNYATLFPPYSKKTFLADFDNGTGKMTGTWGWDNSYSNGGKFEMTKQ